MLAIMFPIALAGGCGSQTTSNQPASANSQTNSQDSGDDSQDSTDGDGGSPLADGLAGSCEGSDPRLPSVKLDTSAGYLGVEIPGNDQIKPDEFYSYDLMLTNEDGNSWMVQLSNYVSSGETNRSVFNMQTSKNLNYPGWNNSDDKVGLLNVCSGHSDAWNVHGLADDAQHRRQRCGQMPYGRDDIARINQIATR